MIGLEKEKGNKVLHEKRSMQTQRGRAFLHKPRGTSPIRRMDKGGGGEGPRGGE